MFKLSQNHRRRDRWLASTSSAATASGPKCRPCAPKPVPTARRGRPRRAPCVQRPGPIGKRSADSPASSRRYAPPAGDAPPRRSEPPRLAAGSAQRRCRAAGLERRAESTRRQGAPGRILTEAKQADAARCAGAIELARHAAAASIRAGPPHAPERNRALRRTPVVEIARSTDTLIRAAGSSAGHHQGRPGSSGETGQGGRVVKLVADAAGTSSAGQHRAASTEAGYAGLRRWGIYDAMNPSRLFCLRRAGKREAVPLRTPAAPCRGGRTIRRRSAGRYRADSAGETIYCDAPRLDDDPFVRDGD